MAGSIGIIMSIDVSTILGWFLILGLLFSIQDYDSAIASLMGQPVTQIFLDTVSQKGAIVLMVRRCASCPTPISYPMMFSLADHHHRRDVLLRVSYDIDFYIYLCIHTQLAGALSQDLLRDVQFAHDVCFQPRRRNPWLELLPQS
jgi:hypothetical protein